MPVQRAKGGYRWGRTGKVYRGRGAKAKAARQGRAEVDAAPFKQRYRELVAKGELTGPSDLARRAGWTQPDGHADVHKLNRALGLERRNGNSARMSHEDALTLCAALMCDPVDLGF